MWGTDRLTSLVDAHGRLGESLRRFAGMQVRLENAELEAVEELKVERMERAQKYVAA